MDLQNSAKPGSTNSLLGVPEYILNTFFPGTLPLFARSPRFAKLISLILALWWVGPSAFWRLKHFLDSFSSFFISSISISSDEDLFEYLVRWLAAQRTLRKEHSLVASLSNPSPNRKRNSYYPGVADEISPQDDLRNVDIQYESSHGLQWLLFKRQLFFMRRDFGEGSVYNGGKSHRMETLKLSCIGRSTQPIKDLLEEVYREHKDKEKSLTIIRRPFGGHYGRNAWSRISQKPRYVDSICNLLPISFELSTSVGGVLPHHTCTTSRRSCVSFLTILFILLISNPLQKQCHLHFH
jgi:chaperone BCS1